MLALEMEYIDRKSNIFEGIFTLDKLCELAIVVKKYVVWHCPLDAVSLFDQFLKQVFRYTIQMSSEKKTIQPR